MNICLFCSYSEDNYIKNYIKFWLESLLKFNDKVILITNERQLDKNSINFLNKIGVELVMTENKGWDFGLWYEGLKSIDIDKCSSLSLINDSTILFGDLDDFYKKSESYDYFGMTDSYELTYHIQSYMMVIRNKSVKDLYEYFMKNGKTPTNNNHYTPNIKRVTTKEMDSINTVGEMVFNIEANDYYYFMGKYSPVDKEWLPNTGGADTEIINDIIVSNKNDNKCITKDIINIYEMGLTKHLNEYKIGSYINSQDYLSHPLNITTIYSEELVSLIPCVKKKNLLNNWREDEINHFKKMRERGLYNKDIDFKFDYKKEISNICYQSNSVNINYLFESL
jgi:hypothetical protein